MWILNNEFWLCSFSPVSCGSFESPLQCVTVLRLLQVQVTEKYPQHVLVEIFYYTLLSYLETRLCRWSARCKVNSIYYLCRYSLTHIFLYFISFFQQNCLIVIEMDLLSTHNIGFGWGMKTSFEYSYYSVFMIKSDTHTHYFVYNQLLYVFWELKGIISLRWFFWVPTACCDK